MNSTNDHIMDVKKMRKGHLLWPLCQLFVLGLIVGTILYYPATATAGAVLLAWDAPTTNADGSPLTDLAGYKIYVGNSSVTYSQVVSVGRVTAYALNNLSAGQTYFFALTAYDWSLNESGFSNEVSAIAINTPPHASFNFWCSELICSFTDTSTDSDGGVIAWSWNFGEGASSNQQSPNHTYASDDTYTVALLVFDDEGATDATLQDVTARSITLVAIDYKARGKRYADLSWIGATTTNVDIYRNGSRITTITNDGFYTDNIKEKSGGIYTYQVCEAGTSTCSNESTLGETDTGSGDGSGDGTVTCSLGSSIMLSAIGYKVKGLQKADLSWDGATSTNIDIYRDGSTITTTANDGFYTDNIDKKGGGTYTYQVCEAGTYTCSNESTLSETDTSSGDGSGDGSGNGTVTCSSDGSITLSATGYKVKGFQKVDLSWDGAMSTNVDVYRDGSKTTTTANDGFYTDNIDKKGGGTYTYQIYEEGTSTCSNESTVIF